MGEERKLGRERRGCGLLEERGAWINWVGMGGTGQATKVARPARPESYFRSSSERGWCLPPLPLGAREDLPVHCAFAVSSNPISDSHILSALFSFSRFSFSRFLIFSFSTHFLIEKS